MIVFEQSGNDTGQRECGAVEGVTEGHFLILGAAVTALESVSLIGVEVGGGRNFEPAVLRFGIHLEIVAECRRERHVSATESEDTVRQFEFLEETLYVLEHLFVRSVGMLGSVDADNLNLGELVQTVQPTHIFAIRACLATETLGISAVLDGQVLLVDDDVPVEVGDGHLGSRYKVEVVHLAVVHLSLFVGELPSAITGSLIDHSGWHDFGVSGFVRLSEEEIDECALEACTCADIDGEPCAGDFDSEVEIDQVVFLCKLPVGQFLAVGNTLLCNRLVHVRRPVFEEHASVFLNGIDSRLIRPVSDGDSEVILGRGAFGYDVVGDVGDGKEEGGLCLFGFFHLGFVLTDVFLHLTGSLFGLHRLVFLALCHERTNLLGETVHFCRGVVLFLLSGFALCVEFEHFVDCLFSPGKMFLLKTGYDFSLVVINLFES